MCNQLNDFIKIVVDMDDFYNNLKNDWWTITNLNHNGRIRSFYGYEQSWYPKHKYVR